MGADNPLIFRFAHEFRGRCTLSTSLPITPSSGYGLLFAVMTAWQIRLARIGTMWLGDLSMIMEIKGCSRLIILPFQAQTYVIWCSERACAAKSTSPLSFRTRFNRVTARARSSDIPDGSNATGRGMCVEKTRAVGRVFR
jgi:hypothetical protein